MPTTLPPLCLDEAQYLAPRAARLTMQPWHVINESGHLLIADDTDIACWCIDQIVYTVEPEMAFSASELDPPVDIPDEPYPPTPGGPEPPEWLLADIAHVLDMALGNAPARDVIPQLRRIRARITDITTVCRL